MDAVVCFCGLVRMLLGGPELRGSLVCAEGAPLYSHLIPRVLNRLVSSSFSPFPRFVRRSTSDLYRKTISDLEWRWALQKNDFLLDVNSSADCF